MRLAGDIRAGLRAIPPVRFAEFLLAALVMALLTLFIGDLPELEVVESTVNDDSFSDLVITTRGELAIDTSILVVTYGPWILDEEDRVDRALLAQGIAYLMNFDPSVVGVDFIIDGTRPEYPEGDRMLSGVIREYGDRIFFGAYSIDSLGRSEPLPAEFEGTRLGAINLMPGDDRVIRTFRIAWPGSDGEPLELLPVRVAREIDRDAVNDLLELGGDEFLIDYAAGIGEHLDSDDSRGTQVFPSIPMTLLEETIFSESTEDDEALRRLIEGRGVLVGYADVRDGQLTSVVDRFWTPLKPEENSLPDMHGVGVHANILNTILQRRAVREVPVPINVLWGTLIVFLMYLGQAALAPIRPTSLRTILRYLGWASLLTVALFVPIWLFRSTPWKLSVYTPFAGLILGRLVLTIYDRTKRLVIDRRHHRRIVRALPPYVASRMRELVRLRDPRERYVGLLHQVQRAFHFTADLLFIEAEKGTILFRSTTVGSPTPARILADADGTSPGEMTREGRAALAFIGQLQASLPLRQSLRVARSLVIAVNEIDRQTQLLKEEEATDESNAEEDAFRETQDSVITAIGHESAGEGFAESDRLLEAFVPLLAGSRQLFSNEELVGTESPWILRQRCQLHDREETFYYLSEQEDANNRDDFHDLIYAGDTIRCRPETHPGLSEFRRISLAAVGSHDDTTPTDV